MLLIPNMMIFQYTQKCCLSKARKINFFSGMFLKKLEIFQLVFQGASEDEETIEEAEPPATKRKDETRQKN